MKSASDYVTHVRGLFINLVREGVLRRQALPLETYISPDNRRGQLHTPDPGLLYNDRAILMMREEFVVEAEGKLRREQYAYHYERPGGYFFRFEREQHDGDLVYKPEYHLHVLWRLPHFPSAPLTLEETLDFIHVNFYGVHRQRLVGHSLEVQI
ncbi:MAG: hypothetical protein ACE5HA_10290 [Anaerolineae bacterium]